MGSSASLLLLGHLFSVALFSLQNLVPPTHSWGSPVFRQSVAHLCVWQVQWLFVAESASYFSSSCSLCSCTLVCMTGIMTIGCGTSCALVSLTQKFYKILVMTCIITLVEAETATNCVYDKDFKSSWSWNRLILLHRCMTRIMNIWTWNSCILCVWQV